MPQIGDTARARDLGYKGKDIHIWIACPHCLKERWVKRWQLKTYFINKGLCLNCYKQNHSKYQRPLNLADKTAKCRKPWSEEDLEYLAHRFGLVKDKTLATRLQRTESAIITTASKKYSISRINNYNSYTAASLADALGINKCSIDLWIKKGWLKGRRLSNINGARRIWRLTEWGIIECLRKRPWLVLLKPTPQWLISEYSHHFFYLIRKEWEKDPWYTVEQAAPLLGLSKKSKCAVFQYIRMGWLRAEKKPCRGSSGGVWIIRRSAIQAFLENDPRPQHKYVAERDRTHRFLMSLGYPYRLATIWVLNCPSCRQEVRIAASAQLNGAEVRAKFISIYVNGVCSHGAAVELTIPLSGFRISSGREPLCATVEKVF